MSKEKDYIDKIEVHRQEVELDEVSRRRTRTRSSRKQNKAPKSPMIKILVVIFILIPLSLLGYVWLFYEPEVEQSTEATDNSLVHIEKNNTPATSSDVEEDDESDQNDAGQDNSNTSSNDVEVDEEEEQAIAQAAAEAEKKLKEQQQKEEEEANKQSSNTSNAKTHVVEATDTLFSIAMKYYKDPTKVDAIKKANNLSSDSIPLGKELILP
jgi:colicin import membrane protein